MSMEPGNEPFIVGDECVINGRVGTVSYSQALEGFFATYYHLSIVWRDDLTVAQFTDNIHKSGIAVVARNPRTKQSVRLTHYAGNLNETKETASVCN